MAALRKWASAGIIGLSITIALTGLFCAEVQSGGWPDDGDGPIVLPDGGSPGDADMTWHCFTGTPTTEPQLFDRCTEAERVDRASYIPPTVWMPGTPLP